MEAKELRKTLENFGIDVNDANNGVRLTQADTIVGFGFGSAFSNLIRLTLWTGHLLF